MADEDDSMQIFDPSMKKKKNKKKKTPFDPNSVFTEGGDAGEDMVKEPEDNDEQDKENREKADDFSFAGDDFPGMKKKKKKKTTFSIDELEKTFPEDGDDNRGDKDEGSRGEELNDDDLDLTFLTKKKKKKKALNIEDLASQKEDVDDEDFILDEATNEKSGLWVGTDRDYTYDELLTRVFDIMREKNPDMVAGEKRRFVMRPPQVLRVGTKKTSFANFTEICKMLHRQPKHLLAFLLAELGTSGSVDGNNQLIIKGRFQQKQIETVLRRYIKEYVTCHTCRSPDTILQRDTRIFFLQCESCGSRCSVASIKAGFQAVTGKRAAIRAKTA